PSGARLPRLSKLPGNGGAADRRVHDGVAGRREGSDGQRGSAAQGRHRATIRRRQVRDNLCAMGSVRHRRGLWAPPGRRGMGAWQAASDQCVMGRCWSICRVDLKEDRQAYRLLTEEEWEYAARAVTRLTDPYTPFSTGATINYKQANYDANFTYGDGRMGIYRQKTLEVGSFPRNAFGLHDMHGNVWEWVQDCYKDSYEGVPADGSPVASVAYLRILRGGSWNYRPQLLRSAYRYATAPEVRLDMAGFRIARSL